MKVRVFAILKDYYNETFDLESDIPRSIEDLKEKLITLNPAASHILNSCRFAVNEEFVSGDFQLKENEHIYVLPPSSGG